MRINTDISIPTITTVPNVPAVARSTHTVWSMWRRLRRRTMAPSRPAIYPDQLGLVLICFGVIGVGVYFAVRAFLG